MNGENDEIVHFLESHEEEIVCSWKNQLSFSQNQALNINILKNSRQIYTIITSYFKNPNEDITEPLKLLAEKTASDRIKTGIHINSFIKNIYIVKEHIHHHILNYFKHSGHAYKWAFQINHIFDSFILHTASYFSDFQHEIIQKQNEILSETHKERLTLLGQMTSSFVHEFRNPLTSIKGFIQLLRAEHPELSYLNIVHSELEQLNMRISEFLALSRKDEAERSFVIFSLDKLIDEVITFLYPSIVDINVQVITNIENNILILGQIEEIRQVLLNIVFNALDVLGATPNPAISITSHQNDANVVFIKITNNGPQISEDLIEDIFKPFMTTKAVGTGLGLFVCKQIIEKHNGTLFCESTPSQTTFTITLPLAKFT